MGGTACFSSNCAKIIWLSLSKLDMYLAVNKCDTRKYWNHTPVILNICDFDEIRCQRSRCTAGEWIGSFKSVARVLSSTQATVLIVTFPLSTKVVSPVSVNFLLMSNPRLTQYILGYKFTSFYIKDQNCETLIH